MHEKRCNMLVNSKINVYPEEDGVSLPFRLLSFGHAYAKNDDIFSQVNYQYLLVEYVLSGYGSVEIDSIHYECGPDSIYILPPGKDHIYKASIDDPWEKFFFICYGELVDSFLSAYHLDSLHVINDCAPLLHYFRELEILESEASANFDASILIHKLLQEIFITHFLFKNKNQVSKPVSMLKNELDRSLEKHVTLEDLASKIGFSKVYLIKMFKNEIGMSPYEYLLNNRIESSKLLLSHSSLLIKQIADRFCFSDQYHFSNYFKKKTGLSPKKFRKTV